jgi:hypothetical protein
MVSTRKRLRYLLVGRRWRGERVTPAILGNLQGNVTIFPNAQDSPDHLPWQEQKYREQDNDGL